MAERDETAVVKAQLAEVTRMLEEIRSHLSVLGEDQVLWTPPGEDVWPILRAVTHCVNCEHRAATELERAIEGLPTPETVPADTGIFAWLGPTPYALARMVGELASQVEKLAGRLEPSHLEVEAVRYATHPARKLAEYVGVMHRHTTGHLEGIRKKMEIMPPTKHMDADARKTYPNFGRGASKG